MSLVGSCCLYAFNIVFDGDFVMCTHPYIARKKDGSPVCVPCGKCLDCRKAFQNEWTFRLSQEMKRAPLPCFVTLTYNDENLPLGDGDISQSVLVKSDLQKFLKRLRKNGGDILKDMRFFAVGEYGRKSARAHYHLVVIAPNLRSVDTLRKLVELSWSRYDRKTCQHNSLGFSMTKFCTSKQVHYVCKYMNKLDERPHLVKPFRTMSKSIGLNFLSQKIVDYYLTTFSRVCQNDKFKIGLPRYYKRKLDDLSKSHWMLKRAGLTYLDLIDKVVAVEGSKYYYFNEFIQNFDNYAKEARRYYRVASRKFGYQYHEPTDNEIFALYFKGNKYLVDVAMTADRILNDCVIRNGLKNLEPIAFGYRDIINQLNE